MYRVDLLILSLGLYCHSLIVSSVVIRFSWAACHNDPITCPSVSTSKSCFMFHCLRLQSILGRFFCSSVGRNVGGPEDHYPSTGNETPRGHVHNGRGQGGELGFSAPSFWNHWKHLKGFEYWIEASKHSDWPQKCPSESPEAALGNHWCTIAQGVMMYYSIVFRLSYSRFCSFSSRSGAKSRIVSRFLFIWRKSTSRLFSPSGSHGWATRLRVLSGILAVSRWSRIRWLKNLLPPHASVITRCHSASSSKPSTPMNIHL